MRPLRLRCAHLGGWPIEIEVRARWIHSVAPRGNELGELSAHLTPSIAG
jgi:hypothetical protein